MIQKDYIMRMIEQMAEVLAKVLFNKEEGKKEEALKEIDNSFNVLVGVDSKLINSLPIEHIAELFGISKDKPTGSMKCIIAGKLLKEKSKLLQETAAEESEQCLHKALGLFLRGILNIGYTELDLANYIDDIKEIENDLRAMLSSEEMFHLFTFYRKIKEFDKAENYLFHLKDVNYPDIKRVGLTFLRELDTINSNNLAAAGLTTDEVKESIRIFENI